MAARQQLVDSKSRVPTPSDEPIEVIRSISTGSELVQEGLASDDACAMRELILVLLPQVPPSEAGALQDARSRHNLDGACAAGRVKTRVRGVGAANTDTKPAGHQDAIMPQAKGAYTHIG